MSTNLPIKTSSRSGRFKKKLVSLEALSTEASIIEGQIEPYLEFFNQGQMTPAEFCAVYLIVVLNYRFPNNWPGAKRNEPILPSHQLLYPLTELKKSWAPHIQRRLEGHQSLGDIINSFAFQSTPMSVNRSLLCWQQGDYKLELMFRIPSPQEVLSQQKRGKRCVTIILDKKKASQYILGERDSLSFYMHDLIHADHFFHNNICYQGQLGFYGFLDFCLHHNHFDQLLTIPSFVAEFEYLISDMNAYAVHLMKCLKSALVHYHDRGIDFFKNWLYQLDLTPDEFNAFNSLNTKDYKTSHDEVLLNLLKRFQIKLQT